ncbi:MAG: hypothetical protein IPJ60_18915 [Sphingobacteriaceae bacterium]|nr:hypothetical protein [Sphingobacteriaceae bacterium]
MIFDIFASALNIFLKHRKGQIEGDSDLVHIRKRQLLHKGIPDLEIVKRLTGDRFSKLLDIFNRFDPIKTQKLSDNPDKYLYFTKTVIYKLPRQKTKDAVADLLYIEFSLWFKHAYNDFDDKDELIDEVYNFKKMNFITDPFQKNTADT